MTGTTDRALGWGAILRLGMVQAALGAVVVLATSTLNRVMVVELALPAMLPGALIALHYAVQIARPRLGHGSDMGNRRTPWIIGGMAVMAMGGIAAAAATLVMREALIAGLALAVLAYGAIGLGVGAAGTSLLVLLSKRVAAERRPAAASLVWIMMIAGIGITAGISSQALHPFSFERLMLVSVCVSAAAMVISLLAVTGIEGAPAATGGTAAPAPVPFRTALAQVWAEPAARRFTIFVFLSMLAYSAQELILEPFAAAVFAKTPAETAGLTGLQHAGALIGMALVALSGSVLKSPRVLRWFTIGGCAGSGLVLLTLALASTAPSGFPLRAAVTLLGVANGAFAVAAIGSMMGFAREGRSGREGTRMGLWGAAQALAFAAGGLLGTLASDLARAIFGAPDPAYAAVFVFEALLFAAAALQAARVFGQQAERKGTIRPPLPAHSPPQPSRG